MPLTITCPRCSGHGYIEIGMSWGEAVKLADRVLENKSLKLEGITAKHTQDVAFYVVTITDTIFRNTIFELRNHNDYLTAVADIEKKVDERNATSGNTHATSDSSK